MAVDSFQWSDLRVGLRLKFSKQYTLNLTGNFDTYTYGYNEKTKTPYRVDIPRWRAGKGIGRLRSTGTSFSYTINQDTFSKLLGKKGDKKDDKDKKKDTESSTEEGEDGEDTEQETSGGHMLGKKENLGEFDQYGYMVNNIPWSLSFSYSMSLGYGAFDPQKLEYKYQINNSLSFNGNIQPTKNWRFNFSSTFDFDVKKISYMSCSITREMHCFQMSANFIPVGPYKSYSFSISVSSALLKDLKYDQRSNYRDSMDWY